MLKAYLVTQVVLGGVAMLINLCELTFREFPWQREQTRVETAIRMLLSGAFFTWACLVLAG